MAIQFGSGLGISDPSAWKQTPSDDSASKGSSSPALWPDKDVLCSPVGQAAQPSGPMDPEVLELATKIDALATSNFGGSMKALFDAYAGYDQKISSTELKVLLEDAGVGNFFTRGQWVTGIMKRLDDPPNGDGDGLISWSDYSKALPK